MPRSNQGEIPGVSYDISGWSVNRLRQWLQQNMHAIIPSGLNAPQVSGDTVAVSTELQLGTAALSKLKSQLGDLGGAVGPTGPAGPAGPAGPGGPAGTPGSVWRDGSGAPANTLGVDGDYYLDDASGFVYAKASGVYSHVATLSGPTVTMAHGNSTVTFSAAASSATVTIAHGLGTTPTCVQLTADEGASWCLMSVVSKDATNIVVRGHDAGNVGRTGTNVFYWLALA